MPDDPSGVGLDAERLTWLGGLKEHGAIRAPDAHVLKKDRRRIGDGWERDLPPLAQPVYVRDGQRALGRVVSAARRIEPEYRPVRRQNLERRRAKKSERQGEGRESLCHATTLARITSASSFCTA
jgi:hypothetical protein